MDCAPNLHVTIGGYGGNAATDPEVQDVPKHSHSRHRDDGWRRGDPVLGARDYRVFAHGSDDGSRRRGVVHLSDPATTSALREAIRKDVVTRLDAIANRLEGDMESAIGLEELEVLLTEALTEATRAFADGLTARVRELNR